MKIVFEWFQHEKIESISSSYRVMFFLLNGQKSEQANREHINPAGKHVRFSCVTYFFMSLLVKIWKIRVFQFTVKYPKPYNKRA